MIELLLNSVIAGTVLFVVANIDDLLVLIALLSDPRVTLREIVFGQFIGIGVLVTVSLIAATAAFLLPMPYVGLLGLVPVGMGIHKLFDRDDPLDDESRLESNGATS
jgi:cadmium resistance protein CadD (predicted permease)